MRSGRHRCLHKKIGIDYKRRNRRAEELECNDLNCFLFLFCFDGLNYILLSLIFNILLLIKICGFMVLSRELEGIFVGTLESPHTILIGLRASPTSS